ncbi:MAG TPA: hypothetical protein VGL40_01175 [Bacillota bacterium]
MTCPILGGEVVTIPEEVRPTSDGQAIIPGPCTPITPCPPITEIVCVDVDKVFDSCSDAECQEFCIVLSHMGLTPESPLPVQPLTIVSCAVVNVFIENLQTSAVPGQPLLQRITGDVCPQVAVTFTDATGRTYVATTFERIDTCFHKDTLLYMPDPATMFPKIEVVTATCLGARVQPMPEQDFPNICMTVGIRVIIKSEGRVQLMVGAFGYCPVPPTCRELGTLCEGFIAAPFPTVFPPEIFEVDHLG